MPKQQSDSFFLVFFFSYGACGGFGLAEMRGSILGQVAAVINDGGTSEPKKGSVKRLIPWRASFEPTAIGIALALLAAVHVAGSRACGNDALHKDL